jgi:hypothetical protein
MLNPFKIAALAGIGLAGFFALNKWSQTKSAEKTVVHTGVLEKIEYTTKHSTAPSYVGGAISMSQMVKDATIVFFQDGSQILVDGKIDILFSKGTQVSVQEDGFGRRSLVSTVTTAP